MQMQDVQYRCKGCRFTFSQARLEGAYEKFTGISCNGEAVLYDPYDDALLDQVAELVDHFLGDPGDHRWDREDRYQLHRDVLSAVCDRDSLGDPFDFDSPPRCPRCGSRRRVKVVDSAPWREVIAPTATHLRWDAMAPEERESWVRQILTNRTT